MAKAENLKVLKPASDWRSRELSLEDVIVKYPQVSPFIILKTDVQRRGVYYTEAAIERVDPKIHQTQIRSDFWDKEGNTPVSLLLRDGTSIFTEADLGKAERDPYVVDVVDGKTVLTDQGRVLEEVEYWEKPQYYDKLTGSGHPMWQIVSARPQRLTIHPNQFCDFWLKPGKGCKYCAIAANYKANCEKPQILDVQDIVETVGEALKEPGRNVSVFLTGGTILSGSRLLDDELELYLDILKGISKFFGGRRFPSQLISTAFTKEQLKRLYDETGLMTYTADIEVLNKELFDWICPGKAESIGYEEWKRRLYDAVDVFGAGNVNTGIVGGVELAKPKGFATEEEALEKCLAEADELAGHGVSVVSCVWRVIPGSVFFNQVTPSLEYYVRFSQGLDQIRRKYGINIDMDNYRRCGNHPDTDLARI